MEKQDIQVPEGIRYLSQWEDFGNHLPDTHFILNKAHTGVGATEYFLGNDEKTILSIPRCSLIDCKRPHHPEVCFYRDMNDNANADGDGKVKSRKKATFEDIRKYNEEVTKYVHACSNKGVVPKIMVTYDSLSHVIDALNTVGPDELKSWTLVVDEFQAIFGDSSFKSLTEMIFLENSQHFTKAVFLSATPYLEEYMEQMDEFRNLPYINLVWPQKMKETAAVTTIKIPERESKYKVARKIIDCMRAGKTVRFGTKEIDTAEAVFYINNVNDIIKMVQKCGLKDDEVNILCSRSNEDKLKKEGLALGNFPKEGEPHKMFTFATKSVYLGVDFYSECAFSYVFADPSQKTLALDISIDLPQILGRQRLDRNPYRNEAILFIKENSLGLDDKEFGDYIKGKIDETEALIQTFNKADTNQQEALLKKYRRDMANNRYKDDYVLVVDDRRTGKAAVKQNTLYMLSEIRAWEIAKDNYKNIYSVIREQAMAGISTSEGTASTNNDALAFKSDFESTGNTGGRIKKYCDFRQQHPDLADELDFVPKKYAEYWDALGYDDLKALGFQESKIKEVLKAPPVFDCAYEQAVRDIRDGLKTKRYTSKKLKEMLGKSYKKAGYKKTAKAVDVTRYVTAKPYQDSRTGQRGYEILSTCQKSMTMFPNVCRPNRPMDTTIDRILDIIEKGECNVTNLKGEKKRLKDIISVIRSTKDHRMQGELKREWLPAVCVNGKFRHKDDHGLEVYSSYVALDYDGFKNKAEMDEAKDMLKSFPFVYAIFETPSGLGLKAIVLHDSANPDLHGNLYRQIMDACKLPQSDTGVYDLSRGQFLSHDPDLWRNDKAAAFHFEHDPSLSVPAAKKEKYVYAADNSSSPGKERLDSWTENFLHYLWNSILTDEAILQRLDKYWREKKPDYYVKGNRHKSMLIMAGTLCKAGIPEEKTVGHLKSSYPDKDDAEVDSVVKYAYENNPFGSDRRTYRK